MLKKAIRIFVSLCFILSISAFASMNVSAGTVVTAGTSTYEIVQDFESMDAGSTSASLLSVPAGSATAQIATGGESISGDKSLKINIAAHLPYLMCIFESVLAKPTMPAPKGIFYRIEFNKPGNATSQVLMTTLNNANYGGYGGQWTDFNGGNLVAFAGWGGFKGLVVGYVFYPFTQDWTKDVKLSWDMRDGVADNSAMMIDDIGYYTGDDYPAIAASLNASHTLNPTLLQSAEPSKPLYNNNMVVANPVQFNAVAYHKGTSTILWTVSDPTKATIDANGLLTPIKKGPITVTATLSGTTVTKSYTTNTVVGDVEITSQELENAHTVVFGVKAKLRAAPRYFSPDTTVVWSVKSGPGEIVDTPLDLAGFDADVANTPDVTAVMASFTDSGKVVIRAALAVNPALYSDYVIDVIPSFIGLQADVLAAMGMNTSAYTAESWAKVQAKIDAINALIDKGAESTTQTIIKNMQADLAKSISMLVAAGAGTSEEPNPQTGSGSTSMLALSLTVILLGGLIVTLKRRVLNK